MGVIVRETYDIVTPESAEHGDFSETGFVDEEGTEYDFRELVDLLEGTEFSGSNWYTRFGSPDIRTGEVESRHYHPVDERAERYMAKAFDYVERQHKRWLQKMRDRRNTRHETEEDSASPGF